LLRQKIGLRQQALLNEELNHARPINLLHLIRRVVVFALSVQLVGAMILAIKWVPEFGWFTGLHYSIFHAISAFNNAGFTLFNNSLTGYVDSELVNFAIIGLIILGGLGFTVVLDVVSYRGRRRLELHSQLVIITSVILLVGGTVAIYLLEMNNSGSIADIESTDGKILAAFFQSATARTAGFNTIDIVSMSPASLFFIMGLMFIGAGSTSTGGGIKVSTFAVALIGTRTFLRGQKEFNVLSRRIPPTTVLRSLAIIVVSFFLLITAIFALLLTEEASYPLVMFETLSAFSTVGLSAGLTERLSDPGKLIMVMVMIVGRVGPLTMAYLLASNQQTHLRFSEEDVITG
jgi:trk system potassium uptake protein TrkH